MDPLGGLRLCVLLKGFVRCSKAGSRVQRRQNKNTDDLGGQWARVVNYCFNVSVVSCLSLYVRVQGLGLVFHEICGGV